MNHGLQLSSFWALKWRMPFNPDPTKQAVKVTFPRKISPSNDPPICFNSVPVRKVPEHKHLGIILDSKLSFTSHINAVISKCRQGIGLLKLLSKYLPRCTVNETYRLYIRPYLDYGDVIYHTQGNICEYSYSVVLTHQMEKLESVQYSAARAVTGAWRGTFGINCMMGSDGNH